LDIDRPSLIERLSFSVFSLHDSRIIFKQKISIKKSFIRLFDIAEEQLINDFAFSGEEIL